MSDQLDVHANPGRNEALVPFVVVAQSSQFTESARRVVVPLAAAEAFGAPNSDIGPHFTIGGGRSCWTRCGSPMFRASRSGQRSHH
jgi:hypothetical protein